MNDSNDMDNDLNRVQQMTTDMRTNLATRKIILIPDTL